LTHAFFDLRVVSGGTGPSLAKHTRTQHTHTNTHTHTHTHTLTHSHTHVRAGRQKRHGPILCGNGSTGEFQGVDFVRVSTGAAQAKFLKYAFHI